MLSNLYPATTAKQRMHTYQLIFGAPSQSTLHRAASRGYLSSFIGLTPKAIRRDYQHIAATAMGHLDRTRKNIASTTKKKKPRKPPEKGAPFTIIDLTKRVHSDMSGEWPFATVTKDTRILLMYHEDSNYIHIELAKGTDFASYREAYAPSTSSPTQTLTFHSNPSLKRWTMCFQTTSKSSCAH